MQFLITPEALKGLDAGQQREVMQAVCAGSRKMRVLRIAQYPVRGLIYLLMLLALMKWGLPVLGWYFMLAVLVVGMMVTEEVVSRVFFLEAVQEEIARREMAALFIGIPQRRAVLLAGPDGGEARETPEPLALPAASQGDEDKESRKVPRWGDTTGSAEVRDVSYWEARANEAWRKEREGE